MKMLTVKTATGYEAAVNPANVTFVRAHPTENNTVIIFMVADGSGSADGDANTVDVVGSLREIVDELNEAMLR